MKRKLLISGAIILVIGIAIIALFRPLIPGSRIPIKKHDPWILQSNDPNDPYGTYLGNGYIGARIGADGTGSKGPCLMAGLYEGESMLPIPNWADFPLYDGRGRRFELDKNAPYRQTLSVRDGYVETELTLKSGWQRLRGRVTVFILRPEASRSLNLGKNVAVVRYELVPRFNGMVKGKPDIPSATGFSKNSRPDTKGSNSSCSVTTSSGDHLVVDSVVADGAERSAGRHLRVRRGSEFVLTKYAGVQLMRKGENGKKPAIFLSEDARWVGFEKLFAAHKEAWCDIWKSDIVIEGDPSAQQAVHAMMFYLISSASPGHSIPPMGICLDAWRGHVFWDADIWMFPALILQYPALASGITSYRLYTLEGARRNANKRGLSGAEFAWESAGTGLETAPQPYAEERHITSDVAFAQWQQFIATQDTDWLRGMGWPVIKSSAEYWASRVVYNKVKDNYEILDVVPPDEDAMIVDNSVYTNVSAKLTLKTAAAAAKRLGESYPATWEEIARKMYVPFDPSDRRFIEYDGYKDKQIKQADAELLIYPLILEMPEDVKQNTFDFYKTKADPRGPAMTSSIHAIIAAELDRPKEAYDRFIGSYREFLRGPFLMFNEKRSKTYENMCFMTGCGGTLQSVLYGFAGLRIGKNPGDFEEMLPDLYIKPCLPPKWKKLEIRNINWRGKAYDLTISPGNKWGIEDRN